MNACSPEFPLSRLRQGCPGKKFASRNKHLGHSSFLYLSSVETQKDKSESFESHDPFPGTALRLRRTSALVRITDITPGPQTFTSRDFIHRAVKGKAASPRLL